MWRNSVWTWRSPVDDAAAGRAAAISLSGFMPGAVQCRVRRTARQLFSATGPGDSGTVAHLHYTAGRWDLISS